VAVFASEIAFRVTGEAPDMVKSPKTLIQRLAAKNLLLRADGRALVPNPDSIAATGKEIVRVIVKHLNLNPD